MSPTDPPSDPGSAALDHAWKWFELHAGQRMQLVNFWLVAMAFVVAALATAFTSDAPELAVFLALAGAFATFAFWGLERRTRFLVDLGRVALARFERGVGPAYGRFEERFPLHNRVDAATTETGAGRTLAAEARFVEAEVDPMDLHPDRLAFRPHYGSIFNALYGVSIVAFLATMGIGIWLWVR